MKNKIIALFLVTLAVLPVLAMAAKPEVPGPWKIVGKKVEVQNGELGTCIFKKTSKNSMQLWCRYNTEFTLSQGISAFAGGTFQWLSSDNHMVGTKGTKLHAVGKLTNSGMTDEQAMTRGYDAKWTPLWSTEGSPVIYYLKFNWAK